MTPVVNAFLRVQNKKREIFCKTCKSDTVYKLHLSEDEMDHELNRFEENTNGRSEPTNKTGHVPHPVVFPECLKRRA